MPPLTPFGFVHLPFAIEGDAGNAFVPVGGGNAPEGGHAENDRQSRGYPQDAFSDFFKASFIRSPISASRFSNVPMFAPGYKGERSETDGYGVLRAVPEPRRGPVRLLKIRRFFEKGQGYSGTPDFYRERQVTRFSRSRERGRSRRRGRRTCGRQRPWPCTWRRPRRKFPDGGVRPRR